MYGYGSVHSFVARPQTRPSPLPVLFRCSIPVCLMRGDGGRGDVFAASSRHLQSCLVGVSPPPPPRYRSPGRIFASSFKDDGWRAVPW